MATSKGANTYNRQKWEDSEFPILCQTCLGNNPYIRMTKEKFAKECKICVRPFTVFRWCPGARMRFKKTEICQTCSKLKNTCQTCLLDLEYGLPVQVRDAALKIADEMPKSEVNKEFYLQNMETEIAKTDGTTAVGEVGKAQAVSSMLTKLARTTPYYKRNRPHICSFWVKGECKRGEECPYRHERPSDPTDPLSKQNIKDRYYGSNDPVAHKMIERYNQLPAIEPPEDKSNTTLYISNLGRSLVSETDLRNHFYQFGEIRSIRMLNNGQSALVDFTNRVNAENAAEKSHDNIKINGKKLVVRWSEEGNNKLAVVAPEDAPLSFGAPIRQPGPPGAYPQIPPPIMDNSRNYFNIAPPAFPPNPMGGGQAGFNQHMYNPGMRPPPQHPLQHPPMQQQQHQRAPPRPMHQPPRPSYSAQDPNFMGTSSEPPAPVEAKQA